MIEANLPENEPERLKKLEAYNILETLSEKCLDDIVLLASKICDAPICIISLIDQHRNRFKSSYGVQSGLEVERKYSMCSHAILSPEVMVVEDTLNDIRFHDNPVVRGSFDVRFYAGAPLTTHDGFCLGTLCVLDNKPRTLTADQLQALNILAMQVVQQFELQKSYIEIAKQNQILKEMNESKDKFFSVIAHDLRAPFHGILGFTDVLETEIELLDEQGIRDIAGYLRSTAQATFKLLENLLQWSMSEGGAIVYSPQVIDLTEMTSDVCEILNALSIKKNITIHCDIEDGLSCYADLNMMLSILQNLVSNALKFTPKGGHIYLSAKLKQGKIEIKVKDTGKGMSKEALTNFKNRQQIRSQKGTDGEQGSGLGLLLCMQFVEKNQGKLQVTSHENVETEFTIELPCDRSSDVLVHKIGLAG